MSLKDRAIVGRLTDFALLQQSHAVQNKGEEAPHALRCDVKGGCLLWLPWRRCLENMRRQAGHPLTKSAGRGRTVRQSRRQEVHQRKITQQRHAALHPSRYASVLKLALLPHAFFLTETGSPSFETCLRELFYLPCFTVSMPANIELTQSAGRQHAVMQHMPGIRCRQR